MGKALWTNTLLENDPVRRVKGWFHTQRWAVMRLRVTLKQSAALPIWTCAWAFQTGIWKRKTLWGTHTIPWKYFLFFFLFPKGNPGRISCATVLKRQDWYKREAWCGCDYFIKPNWRHFPALVGGWATPVGKATRVAWPRVLAQHLISTEWRFGRGWNPWSLCSLQELVGHKFIFHPGEWTTESTGWNHQPWLLLSDLVYILNPLWEQLEPRSPFHWKFTGLGDPWGRFSYLVNYCPK